MGEALTEERLGEPLSAKHHTGLWTLYRRGGNAKRHAQRKFQLDASESETVCMEGRSRFGSGAAVSS